MVLTVWPARDVDLQLRREGYRTASDHLALRPGARPQPRRYDLVSAVGTLSLHVEPSHAEVLLSRAAEPPIRLSGAEQLARVPTGTYQVDIGAPDYLPTRTRWGSCQPGRTTNQGEAGARWAPEGGGRAKGAGQVIPAYN